MDIGATKMEGPRQFLQETPTQSAGASTASLGNACNGNGNSVPVDDARSAVALETTPNPLSYWPPPTSALPLINTSKDKVDGPQNQVSNVNHSSKSSNAENANASKTEAGRPAEEAFSPRNLHHNLPPIAGITSSHNYRGVREVHKHSQVNSVDVTPKVVSKSTTDKQTSDITQTESCDDKPVVSVDAKESVDQKQAPVAAGEKAVPEDDDACEIVELPPMTSSSERAKTVDHVFSIPSVINSMPKTLLSPRAPTPFVHSGKPLSLPATSSITEALTLNINSTSSNLSAGSPSPSGRTVPSPHFVAPSPGMSGSPSPSESPRILPSPSNLHRVLSSSHLRMPSPGESPRMLPSPHLQNNPSSPSQRSGPLPIPTTHQNLYLNTPRINESVPSFIGDASRSQSTNTSTEGDRLYKELPRSTTQNFRLLPKANHPSQIPPQRIEQSADGQICRNPFELPLSKQYPQQFQHHHHQTPLSHFPNNIRHPVDPHTKIEHYMNLNNKDPHRSLGAGFHSAGLKPMSPRGNNEKEAADPHKQILTGPLSKGGSFPAEQSQSERRTPNSMRNEMPQRDYPKPMELGGTKPNGAGNIWNRPEASEVGNKNATYMNATTQNVNKNFSKVNGNDFAGRRLPETGYPNPGKHLPESYAGRFNGEKQSASFSPVNQMNPLSQRFPPVPQSNYDLNRQIYDTMTGGSRAVQPPTSKPMDKPAQQFSASKEQMINPQMCKSQSYYPEYPEQDKGKNYLQNISVKPNEYSGQPLNPARPGPDFRANSYGQFNNFVDKNAHDAGQNKRPSVSQPVNPAFQVQVNESRHPQSGPGPGLEHHKSVNFAGRITTSHHVSQSTCSTLPPDRARAIHPTLTQPMFLPKQKGIAEYDAKKLMEAKQKETAPQFSGQQNVQMVHVPGKSRTPTTTPAPVRSKRESPLDLSVKTVRQSADSTAKDDGEVYLQNFRNFLHGPNQPRTETRYPVSQSNDGATGAPKIDFTPNFSGFHAETQHPIPPLQHKSETSVLPPVESFKKFPARLPAPVPQDPKIRPGFPSPKYFSPATMTNQKPQSSMAEPAPIRYPDHFKAEAQKRPANDPIVHPSQPKIPKIDPWKLAFDQQIEQRLNSARMSQQNNQNTEKTLNGVDVNKPSPVPTQFPPNYQTSRHSSSNYRGANMYPRPPVQTSATPYNPSYVQQPQCQPATPQTPQEKIQHRENVGHSPDPEQIIKQISKGVMPDHKLLQDKNVLSILRSSLEEKEAKLMQLREAARRKEKFKDLMSTDTNKKQFPGFEQTSRGQFDKQSLPPFGALTLERMCAPPSFPGHRLNLPRPVDTVKIDIEPTQKYFTSTVKNEAEKSGIPNVDLSPQDDAQGPPTDLDGLAAFLAARIRTKGELKQVGPGFEPRRPLLGHPIKTQTGPAASFNESTDRVPASGHVPQTTNCPPSGSPPKLVRESRLLPPLRRRLFNHNEEETPTTSSAQNEDQRVPPRDPNGIRSSSETSVFDFRESDSEGEMPVLERQTLEEMRRDRKTFGSKQNVSTTTPDEVVQPEKPEVIAELEKSYSDPFWDTAFDMFVEQLEKRPPKRSVRKKKFSRTPAGALEVEDGKGEESSDRVKSDDVSSKIEDADDNSVFEVKKEPEFREKEPVHDGHVKLSSSRLKVYRDEMMKENTKEVKPEGESEKWEKKDEKEPEEKEKQTPKEISNQKKKEEENEKKEDSGVKTRGRAKAIEKEPVANYETDSDERELRSESESTADDDDDSLSLSGLESESSDSETSQESSNSNSSSFEDSETETVTSKRIQTRLQTRSSRQRQVKGTGMKLRSKPIPPPKAAKPTKRKRKRKDDFYSEKKKKPSFGDGSDFRPGWEEECYKFKQQLRMPEKLISISRPPKRSSASLPDLDPYRNSPSLDSSDVSWTKKSETGKTVPESDDSDSENIKQKSKTTEQSSADSDNVPSLLKLRNGKQTQPSSIINLLVKKYGKRNMKKQNELKAVNERKSPRVLPKATNKPELLPTPSLGIGKENVLKDKKRGRESGKKKIEETDSVYLGYFRKKTVNNFKEAFKQKVGLLPQEFSPVILKSRTRTQTRDLKKRATLMEVFGEERPASAPPLTREEDTSTDQEKPEKVLEKRKPKMAKKVVGGVVTRGRGKLTRSGRPGLRSTAVLRSNKAVQISKRHLNSGRKRNMELLRIRAMASKKFSYLVSPSDAPNQLPITKKRLKLRSVRRKFRSGFDYIRKKKKLKKDGDSADGSVKEKRLTTRPTSESVEDVQNEIKNWVINKGLGETILHRAARLGYTDIAAYCLEKMDCSPSPRDNAGYTPLHEACSRGHLEIAKLLLMYGASVSESAKGGIRPLHEAAENGFTELIRLLLSYGADPLLETYTGHTALSLVTDEEARRLIQHHLADVQGNVAPVWTFQGPSSLFGNASSLEDPAETGYDPLCDPPSPQSHHSDYELEASDGVLPPLYRIAGDREPERRWVLMRDLLLSTKSKSRDFILKQLGSPSVREMKLQEFNEQCKCCNLLGAGEKPLTKASKVILIPYDDKVRLLLGVEKVVV